MVFKPLLFLAFSLLCGLALKGIHRFKKVDYKLIFGLFLSGVLFSIPFLIIEHLHSYSGFYIVALVFIGIEMVVFFLKKRRMHLHNMLHHNIKNLRFVSFFVIGLGFAYTQVNSTIFTATGQWHDLITLLPIKIVYVLLMHTLFTSGLSLMHVGSLFAETIYETVFKLLGYYLRITVISVSHYLYPLSFGNNLFYLMIFCLILGMVAFFYIKRRLDKSLMGKQISSVR